MITLFNPQSFGSVVHCETQVQCNAMDTGSRLTAHISDIFWPICNSGKTCDLSVGRQSVVNWNFVHRDENN